MPVIGNVSDSDNIGWVESKPQGGLWGNRLGASIDNYQASMYGLGEELTGSDWLRKQRERNELDATISTRDAQRLGAVDRFADVQGPGDFLNYAGGGAMQSLPYLGEAAAGGLLARGALGGTRAALTAARGAGDVAEAARLGTQLNRWSQLGAVGASYPSAVGDILNSQRDENGETDLGSALAGGVPYAALNAFGLEGAAARMGGFRSAGKFLDEMEGFGGVAARTGATGARTALTEGLSETGQEGVNQYFGRMAVDPDETFVNDKSMERFGEAFAGGATLGGLGGAGIGGWRRSEGYQQPLKAGARADLLNLEPAAPPQALEWNGLRNPQSGETPMTVFPDGSVANSQDMELLKRYGMTPDRLTGIRQGETVDPTMDTGAVSMPGKIIADQGGVAALDAQGADALYGEAQGDPGLAEARRRYLEQQKQKEDRDSAAAQAQEKYATNRKDAYAALVRNNPDGTAMAELSPRELKTFMDMTAMRDSGVISEAVYADKIGQLRDALEAGDQGKKTLGLVSREIAALAAPAPVKQGSTKAVTAAPAAGMSESQGKSLTVTAPAAPAPQGNQLLQEGANVSVPNVAVPAATGSSGSASPDAGAGVAVPGRSDAPAGGANRAASGVGAVGARPRVLRDGDAPRTAELKKTGSLINRVKAAVAEGRSVISGGSLDFSALKKVLAPLDPRAYNAILLSMGVDPKDGLKLPKAKSYAEAEAETGANNVSRIANALGITADVRKRFAASGRDAGASGADVDENTELLTDEAEAADNERDTRDARLSSDDATDEAGEQDRSEDGRGVVSTPGGSQGNIDAGKKGLLGNQSWYKAAVEKGLDKLGLNALADLVVQASSYDDPKNAAPFKAILDELNVRGQRDGMSAVQAAYEIALNKSTRSQGEVDVSRKAKSDKEPADVGTASVEDEGEAAGPAAEQAAADEARPVELEVNGQKLSLKDPKAALAGIEAKIARYKALLDCLVK